MYFEIVSSTLSRWLRHLAYQWPTVSTDAQPPQPESPPVPQMAINPDSLMLRVTHPATVFTVACVSLSTLAIVSAWKLATSAGEGRTKIVHAPTRSSQKPGREGSKSRVESSLQDVYLAQVSSLLTATIKVNRLRTLAPQSSEMSNLGSELEHTIAGLCQIQQLLSLYYSILDAQPGIKACFETILGSLATVISALDGELETNAWANDHKTDGNPFPKLTGMNEIVQMTSQLKSQKESLLFIVDSIQQQADGPGPNPPVPSSKESSRESVTPPGADLKDIIEIPPENDDSPPEYSPPESGTMPTDVKQSAPSPVEIDSNPISPTNSSSSPSKLLMAISRNDLPTLTTLLTSSSANVNTPHGRLRRTPLHECARLNRPQHAILLLQHGALVDTDDAAGDAPIHLACWDGHVDVATVLLTAGNADLNRLSGRDGNTPLLCAIAARSIDMARVLLKHGARVGTKASDDDTQPLHQAAITGQAALCELLIERGAYIDAPDHEDNTPLHYAATAGHVRVVKTLLVEGADASAVTESGLTPLHWASHRGHDGVIKLLLASGVDVNAEATDGLRPIHCAAAGGYEESVKGLLSAGAAIDGVSKWDGVKGTPRAMALARGHKKVAQLLVKSVRFDAKHMK
jgi:ankyrin repeat protein